MACACNSGGKVAAKYVWTDGKTTVVYDSEVLAKYKVLRKGGSYVRQG